MIVGKVPDIEDVKISATDVNRFRNYAKSLIPELFKNVPEIYNNQLYLNASLLLSSDMHFNYKKPIVEEVMNSVYVTGCMQDLIEVDILMSMLDEEKLNGYISLLRKERVISESGRY